MYKSVWQQKFSYLWFQEVYDWVGSQKNMPLYFTLHRGDAVVLHQDQILADQTVNLTERVSAHADIKQCKPKWQKNNLQGKWR